MFYCSFIAELDWPLLAPEILDSLLLCLSLAVTVWISEFSCWLWVPGLPQTTFLACCLAFAVILFMAAVGYTVTTWNSSLPVWHPVIAVPWNSSPLILPTLLVLLYVLSSYLRPGLALALPIPGPASLSLNKLSREPKSKWEKWVTIFAPLLISGYLGKDVGKPRGWVCWHWSQKDWAHTTSSTIY